jgi:hypothetical protein
MTPHQGQLVPHLKVLETPIILTNMKHFWMNMNMKPYLTRKIEREYNLQLWIAPIAIRKISKDCLFCVGFFSSFHNILWRQ